MEVNDLLSDQYSASKNITFKTSVLRSDLCDYSDAYIVVRGRVTVDRDNNSTKRNKYVTFEKLFSAALFQSCIAKNNNTFIDSAKDIDTVMPMYNLLGSLWNYYRDEINDDVNKNNAARNKVNNNKTITSKSFGCKEKLIGSTPNDLLIY